MTRSPESFRDTAWAATVFGLTAVVYFPVAGWLMSRALAHGQLLHAFLVLLMTAVLLVAERRLPLRPVWEFSNLSQNLLLSGYALLLVAAFSGLSFITLASLAFSLAAFLLFLLGSDQRRLVWSLVGPFTFFTGLAVLMPLIDWPLRTIAGECAAYGLNLAGQEAQLGLVPGQTEPMLILVLAGKPFHVAAECNGFGMISSSLLMALVIVLYRRIRVLAKLGWLVVALLAGFLFNTLRIILIVLIAPHIPDSTYMLMHEAVGLLTTYGGLFILYLLLMPRRHPRAEESVH